MTGPLSQKKGIDIFSAHSRQGMIVSRFNYLIGTISTAEFTQQSFRHVEIRDFLNPEDFREVVSCPKVAVPEASDDADLLAKLFERGFRIIPFPGSSASRQEYLDWHAEHIAGHRYHPTCERFGVTLRLMESASAILRELNRFLLSDEFIKVFAERFDIPLDSFVFDCGIQKYLDGYEISPHPDIRAKAFTFMADINSNPRSEKENHHTHYMRFIPERRYIQSFWEGNPQIQRCWVPWDWCETGAVQRENNSIVIFAPGNDTLHAVMAEYSHLAHQRTQIYGNLW